MKQRSFYRNGMNHHPQQAATFLDVRKRFGFRSIQIGAWVKEPEKQRAAPLFYDALCDLMLILGGNEALISLRGSLALQYGCGGQPGVSAHYEMATRSFALAKNAGPGSIAHEWFHAFDHYIAEKLFEDVGRHHFASNLWLDDAEEIEHPINELLSDCFKVILLNETTTGPSDYFLRAVEVDKAMEQEYYSLPEELCARAFESFVQDSHIKNHFLVKGTLESPEAKMGIYPQGQHRKNINHAFQHYFSRLGMALQRTLVLAGDN